MTVVGYARVSTTDQSLELQESQLRAAGCEKIFSEQRSGTATEGREELARCLEYCREGDVLVITRLDRLARSLTDLRAILDGLDKKGVGFRCLLQPVETVSSEGRLMLNILGAFAEFETELRRERQAEGIAKARAAKKYTGGKAKPVQTAEILRLRDVEGYGATEIAKMVGLGRATIYRRVPDGWTGVAPGASQ